jgi:hypothetical protein
MNKKSIWRIPLFAFFIAVIFWGIWYLANGELPKYRLWDLLFAPIFGFLFAMTISEEKLTIYTVFKASLILALIPGILWHGIYFSFLIWVIAGIGTVLIFSVIFFIVKIIELFSKGIAVPVITWLSGK